MYTELTKEVLHFQKTGKGWNSVLRKTLLHIYQYPMDKKGWDEEDCSGFLLDYYPRIPGIIKRYKPVYNFETYLNNGLYWFIKTYKDKLMDNKYYDVWASDPVRVLYDDETTPGMAMPGDEPVMQEKYPEYVAERAPEYVNTELETDSTGQFVNPAFRRRIMYLVLLHASELSDAQIDSAARLSGNTPGKILEYIQELNKLTSDRMKKKVQLTERRNECWYKMEQARYRSQLEEKSTGQKSAEWQKKARTWERRYKIACQNLQKLRVKPFHAEIGKVLDTPTGTVDAGLHFIKKAWENSCKDMP